MDDLQERVCRIVFAANPGMSRRTSVQFYDPNPGVLEIKLTVGCFYEARRFRLYEIPEEQWDNSIAFFASRFFRNVQIAYGEGCDNE